MTARRWPKPTRAELAELRCIWWRLRLSGCWWLPAEPGVIAIHGGRQ